MMEYPVFLVTRTVGRGVSLYTLPGQKAGARKKLLDDMMTHGCENVRRKHPPGTVFVADAKQLRIRKGVYFTPVLVPFLTPSGESIEPTLEFQLLLEKYNMLTSHETEQNHRP